MAGLKGFIVYPTYRIVDGKAQVHLYGRLENGDAFLTINHFEPYFFIRDTDVEKAKEIKTEFLFRTKETDLKNFDDEKLTKIVMVIPADVSKLRKEFEEVGIDCYEADIRFPNRFMMDHDIYCALEINNAKSTEEKDGLHIFEDPKVSGVEDINVNLKVLSFDIETDGLGQKLYSISLYSENLKKVIIVNRGQIRSEIKDAIVVDSEKDALVKFNEMVKELDPDIITGWNVVDFDMAFLHDKYKQQKVPFAITRTDQEAWVRIEEGFMIDSKARVPGRVVLDGLQLLRNTFYKLEDYKLDTAASEILGEKKTIGNENKVKEIEDAYEKEPQKLVDYNLKDSELVYNILQKTELIKLTMERSMLVGMPLDRVQASVASFDSLYLRELRKIGYVAASSKINKKDRGVTGGFVMKSKPGIYDNVVVCDFKSLYPSAMRTFNIDPLSFYRGMKKKEKGKEEEIIEAPNGAWFDKKEGLLPSILARLWASRDAMKKKKNTVGSYAIKIHMNSIYGVLANPTCRFYDYDMANAITTFCREITKSAGNLISEEGFDVIYGDTDSIFVNVEVKNVDEAKKLGKKIEETINKHFAKMIPEKYGRKNILEMEFEKLYTRFMMPYQRGSKEGAKKRYAGLLLDPETGDTKIDFTGLEFVRRDWTALSKKFQLTLLEKIFAKEEIAGFVRKFVEEVKEGKYDDLLVYRKALRKSTDEYVKTTPPHVKAARILEEAGKLDSSIIDYLITVDGPQPKSMLTSDIDYDHYIEKQIKPIADSVLVFYDKEFDDLISGSSQVSLFDF